MHAIGMLIEDATEYHFTARSGVADVAREHDVNLITFAGGALCDPRNFIAQGNSIYELIQPEHLDGLVVMAGIGNFISRAELIAFCHRHDPLPIVYVAGILENIPSVVSDNENAWRDLLTHLIVDHGYHRIAFIKGPENNPDARQRYRVYTEVLAQYNLLLDPDLILPGDFNFETGVAAMKELLDQHVDFDAVAASSDKMAFGALQVLRDRGILVPESVAVIGFDDLKESQHLFPPLSTVRQPIYELGRRAAELMLAQIRGEAVPQLLTLPTEMLIRQSCGCPSRSSLQARVEDIVTTATGSSAKKTFISPNSAQRIQILDELHRALSVSSDGNQHPIRPEAITQLLDVLVAELKGEGTNAFLPTFTAILKRMILAGEDIAAWQDALLDLRRQMLPYLVGTAVWVRAENLFHHARIMFEDMFQQAQMFQRLQKERLHQTLREINQTLMTTFHIAQLTDVMAQAMVQLGIRNGYLCLYETPMKSVGIEELPMRSRLILAVTDQKRLELDSGGRRFLSQQLLQEGLLPGERRYDMLVMPLYFREHQLGFVLFEVGPRDGHVYEALQGQLSSALQGAILLEARKRAEEELKQYRDHLEELIKQRTTELIAVNEELQQEIADRTQVEKVLAEERNLLRTLIDHLPDYIFIKDSESRFVINNKAHIHVLGATTPDELIGKTDFDIFPEELARQYYADEQEVLRSGHPLVNREEFTIDPQGRKQWLLTTKVPLRDSRGTLVGLVGIGRDISEHKRAEESLLQLKKAVETMQLGVTITDLEGKILYTNPTEARMHGYQVEDLLGKDVRIFAPSASAKRVSLEQIRAWKGLRRESVNIRKDGSTFPVWLTSEVVKNVEGDPIAIVTSCEDITERKQAEEERKEAALLAARQELKETLEDLKRTRTQLIESAKMAVLGQLIAGVVHEINTPLDAIRASITNLSNALNESLALLPQLFRQLTSERQTDFLTLVMTALRNKQALTSREERNVRQAIQQELETYGISNINSMADTLVDIGIYRDIAPFAPLLREEQHTAILQAAYNLSGQHSNCQNISIALDQVSKIIFALKSYARFDLSGQKILASITDGIEAGLTLYHNQLKHDIEVIKHYADIPAIFCYPDDLHQVWTNLIQNAIYAMNGKGTLEIAVYPAFPHPSPTSPHPSLSPSPIGEGRGEVREGWVIVQMTDSGHGIPDEIKDRIFEPFFTTKPSGEGSGLGLDICQRIVEKHQGKIEVESRPGRTTFSVWLPVLSQQIT